MVSWSTVAVLALTCVVYAAFCAAVVRAFFRARVNRTAYRAAGAWAACFGVTLVGSLTAAPGSEWGTGLDATCARLARSYDLTRREEDVLRLLMEGRTFAEAADELVVSLNTVKSHVRRIYAKMGVNGKADLLEKVSSAI